MVDRVWCLAIICSLVSDLLLKRMYMQSVLVNVGKGFHFKMSFQKLCFAGVGFCSMPMEHGIVDRFILYLIENR